MKQPLARINKYILISQKHRTAAPIVGAIKQSANLPGQQEIKTNGQALELKLTHAPHVTKPESFGRNHEYPRKNVDQSKSTLDQITR